MTEVATLLQMSAITTPIVFGLVHVLCRKLLNCSGILLLVKGLCTSHVSSSEKL